MHLPVSPTSLDLWSHLAWPHSLTRHNGGCHYGVGLINFRIGLSLTWHALLGISLRPKLPSCSILHTVDLALESSTESSRGRIFLTQAICLHSHTFSSPVGPKMRRPYAKDIRERWFFSHCSCKWWDSVWKWGICRHALIWRSKSVCYSFECSSDSTRVFHNLLLVSLLLSQYRLLAAVETLQLWIWQVFHNLLLVSLLLSQYRLLAAVETLQLWIWQVHAFKMISLLDWLVGSSKIY
jgi:hypothetical protein